MFSSLGSQSFLHVVSWASVTDNFHPISYFAQLWTEVPMSLLSLTVSIMLTAKYCGVAGFMSPCTETTFSPRNVVKSPTPQTSSISIVVQWSPGVLVITHQALHSLGAPVPTLLKGDRKEQDSDEVLVHNALGCG